jgi:hypothetical protein
MKIRRPAGANAAATWLANFFTVRKRLRSRNGLQSRDHGPRGERNARLGLARRSGNWSFQIRER